VRRVPALFATAAVTAALLVACSPVVVPPDASPTAEPPIGDLGAPGCDPASPMLGGVIQATGVGDTTASGLLETSGPSELTAGQPLKLVVRMTGSGDLSAALAAPDGSDRDLDWGPEPHGSSNFGTQGDEWGVGFTFDTPGCWALNLRRAGGEEATFWMMAGDAVASAG
jgi:hypothetical protein